MICEVMVPNKEAPYMIRAQIVELQGEERNREVPLEETVFNLRQRYHFRVNMTFDDPLQRESSFLSGYELQTAGKAVRLTEDMSFSQNKAACEFSLVPWEVTEEGVTEFVLNYGHRADLAGARIPVRLKIAP